MPRLHLPPGAPLWSRSVVQFSCYYIFFIFTRFLFVTCFPFFCGQRPRSQIAAVASQRHKRAAQEKRRRKRVSEMDRVQEKIKSEYVEQVQTIVQAAGWGAVPPVVVLFHSIPFRFISFRTHGIPWHCNSYCNAKMCLPLLKLKGSWQTRHPPYSLCVGVARIALCQWHFIACFWAWIEKLPAPQTRSKCPPAARTEVRIMLATENCSS